MASFNRVILVGNLTRDPEVKYTTGGTAVAEIGMAVSRQWFDQKSNERKEETTFVDVTLWGRQAEVAGEYLSKGRPVLIEGRLQLDTWEDKQSGQKRSKLRVVCEQMQMLGSRGEGGGQGGGGGSGGQRSQGGSPRGGGQRQAPSRPQESTPADSFYDDGPSGGPNDEVPF
ncbi:MAG TPA: single-stranded DNA-binding protein [Caulifigura sp.]|jgi:single-strand DNA-binding protein|nr:single-stranded DNA-binding protein [Caulifigura sp.]